MKYKTNRPTTESPARAHPFNTRLRALAERMSHRDLAARLGVNPRVLQNWLYTNVPGKFTIDALTPVLEVIEREIAQPERIAQ